MSHLLLDLTADIIPPLSAISTKMVELCDDQDFKILDIVERQFEPHGETIVIVLSESHFTVHTYPEKNMVAIDLYSCRYKDVRLHTIATEMALLFDAFAMNKRIVERVGLE